MSRKTGRLDTIRITLYYLRGTHLKQFNGPKRIEPSVPLRRCQEWTDESIRALKNEGALQG